MDEIKYRKKKQFMKKRLGVFAAAIVLIIGVSMVGIQYTRFVSKTVYQESTSHLTEIFHQSNKALNELVNKNLTYLHMWSAYLQKASTEKEICDYINKVQEETGFSGFYFLSFDGNYKTITGETGYLGLQGNLDDKITQRNDIIMNAALPGKSQMLVFACPEVNGIYQGFEYDAIAVAYDNSDIVKVLDISAFQGNAGGYVVHSDGRVVIDHAPESWKTAYNFIAVLRDHSGLSEDEIMAFSEELKQGHTGAMLVNLEGRNYYLIYEKVNIQDWALLGIVPADIVNASMNELQFSTLIIVGALLFSIAAFIIVMILRKTG